MTSGAMTGAREEMEPLEQAGLIGSHISPEATRLRERLVARRWLAGEDRLVLARSFGVSSSGIYRMLARVDAQWRVQRALALGQTERGLRRDRDAKPRRKPGPPPVWPDCPPHLIREYQQLRAVIGSRAAREQLERLEGISSAIGPASAPASTPIPQEDMP